MCMIWILLIGWSLLHSGVEWVYFGCLTLINLVFWKLRHLSKKALQRKMPWRDKMKCSEISERNFKVIFSSLCILASRAEQFYTLVPSKTRMQKFAFHPFKVYWGVNAICNSIGYARIRIILKCIRELILQFKWHRPLRWFDLKCRATSSALTPAFFRGR